MTKLDKIELFFKEYKYTNEHLQISNCEIIVNLKEFVGVNIKYLIANSGNKLYLPYFDRLNNVYNICVRNKEKLNLKNKTK